MGRLVVAEAIFLSAGVPDPKRGPDFAATADSVAITAAVTALVHVTLGRRLLVWGGHPSITPMVWVVAEGVGVDYGGWVKLYQSRFFEDEFPEDNQRFDNVSYSDPVAGHREMSLAAMRERMFSESRFSAAVFIGGMAGVVDEFRLFREKQPDATIVPVASTGGAALEIARYLPSSTPDLLDDLDYVALFHRHLGISEREDRFRTPSEQPEAAHDRYWKPPKA